MALDDAVDVVDDEAPLLSPLTRLLLLGPETVTAGLWNRKRFTGDGHEDDDDDGEVAAFETPETAETLF